MHQGVAEAEEGDADETTYDDETPDIVSDLCNGYEGLVEIGGKLNGSNIFPGDVPTAKAVEWSVTPVSSTSKRGRS